MSRKTHTAAKAVETLFVNQFTNGILNPEDEMLGPVRDGGTIIANTAPGCWGPMITPSIRGGHEVTKPVYVEGAEVGDAIAIKIKSIEVKSIATASGHDVTISDRFIGDPFVAGKCPNCGEIAPKTVLKGIGQSAVRCANCGSEASPFKIDHGYTMTFHPKVPIGVTVPKETAEKIAEQSYKYMRIPENSQQNPITTFAPGDLVGAIARMRPFLGQLGTTPSIALPDSHNAGDFGSFLIGAPHEYSVTKEELDTHRTDGHMDISRVRKGAILICPVKVPGGGVYVGDMHAMQGDGEIAGHTTDVAGLVELEVHVLKGLTIEGPILLPNIEDLPYTAKPFSKEELIAAQKLAKTFGFETLEESLPLSFIGTGENLNIATDNALNRAANLLDMSVPEVMNRATINGSIEIGRHPGVVTATFLIPKNKLQKLNLLELAEEQYETEK
ncbi:acetamidase/formamidase family protein [Ureibacillus thermophilus]|uniref:Acetamidase/formamidase family protein n=1 Tax=Ureibacillus thermophilus TaxID=367743 RepID=A0A4V1A353_9BACL|nr:acetamidase/formamidase family protein [Ureibacillus thermophilus]QBK26050.1 acetamidase/formamidase family protein [Ureibacillus thermophilus]